MHRYPLMAAVSAAIMFAPLLIVISYIMFRLHVPMPVPALVCVVVTLLFGYKLLPKFIVRWDRYWETRE